MSIGFTCARKDTRMPSTAFNSFALNVDFAIDRERKLDCFAPLKRFACRDHYWTKEHTALGWGRTVNSMKSDALML